MSNKKNKKEFSFYRQAREDLGMTRAEASEAMLTSEDRLEKIENGYTRLQPEDVIQMAKVYKKPSLINHYCAKDCALGKGRINEITMNDFSQIILNIIVSLNSIDHEKNHLIEIAADGKIEDSELHDFINIKNQLKDIANSVEALQLWLDKMIASGDMEKNLEPL